MHCCITGTKSDDCIGVGCPLCVKCSVNHFTTLNNVLPPQASKCHILHAKYSTVHCTLKGRKIGYCNVFRVSSNRISVTVSPGSSRNLPMKRIPLPSLEQELFLFESTGIEEDNNLKSLCFIFKAKSQPSR